MALKRIPIQKDAFTQPEPRMLLLAALSLPLLAGSFILSMEGYLDSILGLLGHPILIIGTALGVLYLSCRLFWTVALQAPRFACWFPAIVYGTIYGGIGYYEADGSPFWGIGVGLAAGIFIYKQVSGLIDEHTMPA